MALIKFVIYSLVFTFAYWLGALLLMESIEPFLNANLIMDLFFTTSQFVIFFLFIKRFYKRFFGDRPLPPIKSVIKVFLLIFTLFFFYVVGFNLGI